MRVVCIMDLKPWLIGFPKGTKIPVVGNVYTVRDSWTNAVGKFGYSLEEITNPIDPVSGREIGFVAIAFRPLDETRLDQFLVHLNPKRVEEKMDA